MRPHVTSKMVSLFVTTTMNVWFSEGGVGSSLLPVSVASCSWPGKQRAWSARKTKKWRLRRGVERNQLRREREPVRRSHRC